MRVPYAEGQFVRTNFPYKEAPTRPGERRIGYVAGIDRTTDPDNPTALVLYTTSSENWMRQNEGTLGFKQFTEQQARKMGQDRAFMIQANRVARLPLTASFFPEINNRNDRNGIVGVAPKAVQTELRETLVNMIKNFRHKMIHSGPPTKKPAVETAQPKAAAAEPVRPQQPAEGTTRRKTLTLR